MEEFWIFDYPNSTYKIGVLFVKIKSVPNLPFFNLNQLKFNFKILQKPDFSPIVNVPKKYFPLFGYSQCAKTKISNNARLKNYFMSFKLKKSTKKDKSFINLIIINIFFI